ncbi:winged helix DNA-binding protein [Prauserella shujinwangii]|uniref:Winged helix DNA-binding protein n=1 Tax=Prauserella shujinwangii TaxID=1453103 RepID=A0A2T0LM91_9PSEU|nr:crosslink repair DNA glycosylase YcaQ family protein [Prauserella shujinwangii]PRX44196.1 winged helix DNA-binding protein [Prauserella shujinwangii]
MPDVQRAQVLAYRIAAHGLHRAGTDPAALAVLDLGVQDVGGRATASLAVAARTGSAALSLEDDERFTLAWTHRGAPHYHRASEFPGLLPALFPVDDADALARLGWRPAEAEAAGMPAREILLTAARSLRKAVGHAMTKGAASAAVTRLVPDALSRWCRGCQATHIHEQLMRLAAPLAGLALVPGASPATLVPVPGRPRIPAEADVPGATGTVQCYLRLHGPATAGEAAGFVGSTRAIVAGQLWPGDLAEVRVEGRTAHLPADRLAELEHPPEPDLVRLLPPGDPYLQARDRALLVPEKARQQELWRVLGNPGALLADGEIAGTWRAKASGRRLEITVDPFRPLPRSVRARVEAEAELVAAVRGQDKVAVRWPGS